jgi:hypothetical protein
MWLCVTEPFFLEANSSSVGQKFPPFNGSEISLPFSQVPTVGPILSQVNPARIFTSYCDIFPLLGSCRRTHKVLMKDYKITWKGTESWLQMSV